MNLRTRDMRPGIQRPFPGIQAAPYYHFGRPPVGVWMFAESAGSLAVDHSALGNHGTLNGGAKRVAARDGHAIELDGISQYVSVPHSASLMPKRLTVAVRTRNLVTPAEFDVILIKCTDANWNDGYGIFYGSGGGTVKFFVTHFSTGGVATASVTPTADMILVGTYDGATSRLFVNGVEGSPASYSGGISACTAPLELGRGRSDVFNINGHLHWVQIYDYALPREEARLLSAGVNPWSFLNPQGPPRVASYPYGTALNITTTAVAGDGITRTGLGDRISRGGGKA